MNYEKLSAERRCCQKGTVDVFINYGNAKQMPDSHFHATLEETDISEEDAVAMLFYDTSSCRIIPFEHLLRICPWLNEHSVMRTIPEMPGIYYLYEENTEIETGKGICLVGPIVVIKLNADSILITPDAMDRYRVRWVIKENTVAITFAEGNSYEAFRRI